MPIVIDPPVAPPLPPPADDGSALWELVYEAMGYLRDLDPETGFQFRGLIEDLTAPYGDIYDLIREMATQPAPFALLFDPQAIPAKWLPYQSQYVGVVPTPEMSEAQLRAENAEPTGWKRGQPESIRIAARRTLKPVVEGEELFVIIRPRTPEPGHHFIRTLLSQTPDPARTERILREEVPAWELIDYAAITGEAFADLTGSKYTTFGAVADAFPNFKALTEALPGDL